MAFVKVPEFLLNFFKQLDINSMPPEIRSQFKSIEGAKQLNPAQLKWPTLDAPLPDANDAVDGFDPAGTEWEKLFNIFQSAFRSMDASRDDFKDDKAATEFLDEWFGRDKLFSLFQAPRDVATQITALHGVLSGTHRETLYSLFQANNLFENRAEFTDFLTDITAGKYNTKEKVRAKLVRIASALNNAVSQDSFARNPALKAAVESVNLARISSGFDDTGGTVDPARLTYFKDNYQDLLKTLYKKEKVRTVFAAHDDGKISKYIDKALQETNYRDGDNKIPPKRDDELTAFEQIERWWGDTYDDCLDKYISLRGDRLFFSNDAKFIVKAIGSAKIKPTDGLGKVVSEAEKIKANLQYKSPKAAKSFDYFVKIMKELQATMPKAFAGALKNGWQLRAIIEEMCADAVKNGKVAEAMVAMEVLSVIKYSWTTSKVMETLKNEKFSMFSDGGLSWNKVEGMKFMTTALDKGIKFAFMTTGYGITMINNKVRMSGRKFNGKPGRLLGPRNAWQAQNTSEKSSAIRAQANAEAQRLAEIGSLTTLSAVHGINPGTIAAQETALAADYATLRAYDKINELQDAKDYVDSEIADTIALGLTPDPDDVRKQAQLNAYLTAAYGAYPAYAVRATQPGVYAALQGAITGRETNVNAFHHATENVKFLDDEITKHRDEITDWDDNHQDQYLKLMAHWDYLESGNTTSWSPRRKSAKQKDYDAYKQVQADAFTSGYSYR